MVCHETYKDKIIIGLVLMKLFRDGKKFFKKNNQRKVIVGPSESMSKSKKNTIDPEKIIKDMELML